MQPFPIPYEPTQFIPCRSLRSRREVNTRDAVNARHVDQWNTDPPSLVNNRKAADKQAAFDEMMPISTRTYAEDLKQWYSFQTPPPRAKTRANAEESERRIRAEYTIIQQIDKNLRQLQTGSDQWNGLQIKRREAQARALEAQQEYYDAQSQALSENPYFTKYDVASDPRNVIRELRGAVVEDKVDRGIREARTLLSREFDDRWVSLDEKEKKGYDSLTAYDLMRPRLNIMEMNYRAPTTKNKTTN